MLFLSKQFFQYLKSFTLAVVFYHAKTKRLVKIIRLENRYVVSQTHIYLFHYIASNQTTGRKTGWKQNELIYMTRSTFTCSKSTMETIEKWLCSKLKICRNMFTRATVFLLLTIFHTFSSVSIDDLNK